MLKRLAQAALGRLAPQLVRRSEIGKFAERFVAPLLAPGGPEAPHREGPLRACPGIVLDRERQVALLEQLAAHGALFDLIRGDPRINPRHHADRDRIRNGYYPTPDAEAYAAFIAYVRPPRIVEVGGGYSTLVARAAIDRLRLGTELVVVDPAPRTDVRRAAHRLVAERAEHVPRELLDVPPAGILFIDSSHVLRAGGDVALLYGEIVPALAAGVFVHVHDVVLPFEYSAFGLAAWWTEQYVLQALLSHSPRYRLELALRWLTRTEPELMARIFGRAVLEDPAHGGGAIWFRVTGGDARAGHAGAPAPPGTPRPGATT